MIPNNNLSVLPWYTSLDQQNARKWWVYNRVYPLYAMAGYMPPFQLLTLASDELPFFSIQIRNANDNSVVVTIPSVYFSNYGIYNKTSGKYKALIYTGQFPIANAMFNGRYYAVVQSDSMAFYSEIFTVVNDISPYLKLEWWDVEDFIMDAGAVFYTNPAFKNVLYLPSDIAKPEYIFEEEGETRDGYFFPTKQISEKRYRFNFLAPEYLLDVMRFVRMADFARITKNGQVYSLDTFLITPEWEDDGDVAVVEAQFDTATVAKKIGLGYIKAQRGDFNDDFNNDYNNQNQ